MSGKMKSINELVSEEANTQWSERDRMPFKAGATFATDLTFERVVEALNDYYSDNGPYRNGQWWAAWLVANK